MMWKLGFDGRWIQLIMICINSVKYQFKVKGECTDVLIPQRGLGQRDPLSPYLFLLCAEGFSAFLNKADVDGSLQGTKVCDNAPSVNHLLFADDSLVLMKASRASASCRKYYNFIRSVRVKLSTLISFWVYMFTRNTCNAKRKEMLEELKKKEKLR
jgi:hypothetical protein